jgi:hypothetical protein
LNECNELDFHDSFANVWFLALIRNVFSRPKLIFEILKSAPKTRRLQSYHENQARYIHSKKLALCLQNIFN